MFQRVFMAMSEFNDGDGRAWCKTSSRVDCLSLRAHACNGAVEREQYEYSRACLDFAGDTASEPQTSQAALRQLRRRYNFISLLCTPCLPPIYLLITPHTFASVIFTFFVIIQATRQHICSTRTGLCSATRSHVRVVPEAMLLLRNCVTEHD
jgi:hypothetical protein